MSDSYIRVPPDSTGKYVDTEALTVGATTVQRQRFQIAGAADTAIAPVSATNGLAVDAKTLAPDAATQTTLAVIAANTLDYDTGAGTDTQCIIGIALPASGGAVAGGTATNPLIIAGTGTLAVQAALQSSTLFDAAVSLTPKFATITSSSSGNNAVVAAVGGKKLRVVAYNFIANGTVNAKFQSDGAGTPVDKTGLKYCVANSGICAPFNPVGWFETVSGKSLDLNLSAAVAVGGELVYVEV